MTEIIEKFRNSEFGFVLLKPLTKEAMDSFDFKDMKYVYRFNSKKILDHNGNVGLVAGAGNLILLDCDANVDIDKKLSKSFPEQFVKEITDVLGETLVIKSSSGMGYQLIYQLIGSEIKARKSSYKHFEVEVRVGNQYIVCPEATIEWKVEDKKVKSGAIPAGSKTKPSIFLDKDIKVVGLDFVEKIDQLFKKRTPDVSNPNFCDGIIQNGEMNFKPIENVKGAIQALLSRKDSRNGFKFKKLYELIKKPHSELVKIYPKMESFSERDYTLITELIKLGFMKEEIKQVFEVEDFACHETIRPDERNWDRDFSVRYSAALSKLLVNNVIEKTNVEKETARRIKLEMNSDFDLTDREQIYKEKIARLDSDSVFLNTICMELVQELLLLTNKRNKTMEKSVVKDIISLRESLKEDTSISASDLMKKTYEPMKFFLKPLIPKDNKGVIIVLGGEGGSGKSLFALLLAVSCSGGLPTIPLTTIEEKSRVCYIDLENSEDTSYQRLLSFKNGMPENINISDKLILRNSFNKGNLKAEFEKVKDFDIIVFDSLVRFIEGDENDSQTMNKLYQEFLKPLRELGRTILCIHHTSKHKKGSSKDENAYDDLDDNNLRGSTDIKNMSDFTFMLKGINDETDWKNKRKEFSLVVKSCKQRRPLYFKQSVYRIKTDEANIYEPKSTIFFESHRIPENQQERLLQELLQIVLSTGSMKRAELTEKIKEEFEKIGKDAPSDRTIHGKLSDFIRDGIIKKDSYGTYSLQSESGVDGDDCK